MCNRAILTAALLLSACGAHTDLPAPAHGDSPPSVTRPKPRPAFDLTKPGLHTVTLPGGLVRQVFVEPGPGERGR